MSTMPSMPLYFGDFLHATMGYTAEQRWSYLAILGDMWERREPIPKDFGYLARVVGVTKTRFLRKIWPAIERHFKTIGETIWQSRLGKELRKALPKIGKKLSVFLRENDEETEPETGSASRERATPTPSPKEEKNARPATEPESPTPNPLPGADDRKIKSFGSGVSGSGSFASQQARDEFAVAACIPHLPGRDDSERWAVAMVAEDPSSPDHERACREMRRAAKAAGVGWVSPSRRGANGHAAAAA